MYGYDTDPAGSVINWPLGSGSATQDGSKDPDPKEIPFYGSPYHFFEVSKYSACCHLGTLCTRLECFLWRSEPKMKKNISGLNSPIILYYLSP